MKAKSNSHFARGTGAYNCRCCGRLTRSTGRGDNEEVTLCAECYDLAGNENSLSDSGKLYDSPENILAWIDFVASKGGKVSIWDDLKAVALKALAPAEPPAQTEAPPPAEPAISPKKLRHNEATDRLRDAQDAMRKAVNALAAAHVAELKAYAALCAADRRSAFLAGVGWSNEAHWSGGPANPTNIDETLRREAALRLLRGL